MLSKNEIEHLHQRTWRFDMMNHSEKLELLDELRNAFVGMLIREPANAGAYFIVVTDMSLAGVKAFETGWGGLVVNPPGVTRCFTYHWLFAAILDENDCFEVAVWPAGKQDE